jgi:tetratricopeptide (TPR) repeat protein/transcriptional regulator with XRE-family HTH domain
MGSDGLSRFGLLLRSKRHEAGLTQDELAGRAGLSTRTVSNLERGIGRPYPKTVSLLANALNLTEAEQVELARSARVPADPPDSGQDGVPLRQLPPAVPDFIGRTAELKTLSGLLPRDDAGAGTVVVSAIGGTAGVGKTALAVHWAHQVAGLFPDGQLYANLRGYDPGPPMPPADALAGFLRALGAPGRDIPADTAERAARYRSLLAERRMLVLLDNAGSAEQVRPLLRASPGCLTLVTSRDTLAGLVARDGARRLDLDLLSPADTDILLTTLIGDRAAADPAATATLGTACARLPLALRVAAELAAAQRDTPLRDLVAELAGQQQRLDLLDADGDSYTAVRAVFSWSYRHLDAGAAHLFRMAGLHPGGDFGVYALAALADSTVSQASALLGRLVRACLIQDTGTSRYGLHDLLRAYAAELAAGRDGEAECQAALTRLFGHYLHTAAVAMDTLYPNDQHNRPRVPRPGTPVPAVGDQASARAWLGTHRDTLVAIAAYAAEGDRPRLAIDLRATVFRFLDETGHFPEAIELSSHALHAARRTGDRVAEAAGLSRLGIIYYQQSRHEQALDHLQRALALDQASADEYNTARELTNLSAICLGRGRYEQAIGYVTEALSICREMGERKAEAHALSNLGFAEQNQGRFQQAIDHLQQSLALFAEVGDATDGAQTLDHLGTVYMRLGRYEQAADCHRQSLTRCRKFGSRAVEAGALRCLGAVYLRLGRCEQAADCHRQSLALAREVGNPVMEARALTSFGLVYVLQGRYERAAEHHRQALDLFREVGVEAYEAEPRNGLGETLLATGQSEQARAEFTAAQALAGQIGNKYEQARALAGLGHASRAAGLLGQARQHWQRALTLYTELGTPEADEIRSVLAREEPH